MLRNIKLLLFIAECILSVGASFLHSLPFFEEIFNGKKYLFHKVTFFFHGTVFHFSMLLEQLE